MTACEVLADWEPLLEAPADAPTLAQALRAELERDDYPCPWTGCSASVTLKPDQKQPPGWLLAKRCDHFQRARMVLADLRAVSRASTAPGVAQGTRTATMIKTGPRSYSLVRVQCRGVLRVGRARYRCQRAVLLHPSGVGFYCEDHVPDVTAQAELPLADAPGTAPRGERYG